MGKCGKGWNYPDPTPDMDGDECLMPFYIWLCYAGLGFAVLTVVVVAFAVAQDRADPGMAYGDPTLEECYLNVPGRAYGDPTLEDCDGTLSCFDCDGNYICGNDMTEYPETAWTHPSLDVMAVGMTVEWLDGYAILTLTTEADIW